MLLLREVRLQQYLGTCIAVKKRKKWSHKGNLSIRKCCPSWSFGDPFQILIGTNVTRCWSSRSGSSHCSYKAADNWSKYQSLCHCPHWSLHTRTQRQGNLCVNWNQLDFADNRVKYISIFFAVWARTWSLLCFETKVSNTCHHCESIGT